MRVFGNNGFMCGCVCDTDRKRKIIIWFHIVLIDVLKQVCKMCVVGNGWGV